MIAFKEPPAVRIQGSTYIQSLRRRATIAVMTLFVAVAVAAAALVPANNHSWSPPDRFVLACGTTPGPC